MRRRGAHTVAIVSVLGALGAGAAAMVVLAVLNEPGQKPATSPTPGTTVSSSPTSTPADDLIKRERRALLNLRLTLSNDGDAELVILGDASSDPEIVRKSWVVQTAQWVGTKYDKSVVLRDWSMTANGYQPERQLTHGKNGTVTIWNGSGTHVTPAYIKQNIAALVPRHAPYVVLSFGHELKKNHVPSQLETIRYALLDRNTDVAFITIVQNPKPGRTADIINTKNNAVRTWALGHASPIINTGPVFHANLKPGVRFVLAGGRGRPNAKGQKLWAQAVIGSLQ